MAKRIRCEYNGSSYSIELDPARTTSGEVRGGGGLGIWYVTVGGTAVTSFPAEPGDTDASVCARLEAWLQKRSEIGERKDIHLGGG